MTRETELHAATDAFEQLLHRYAALTVRVGLNVGPGQVLRVSAPLEAAPFVRLVTAEAYRAGARFVDVWWNDDQVTLARYRHAPDGTLEYFPEYRAQGALEHARNFGALLSVSSPNPGVFAGVEAQKVTTAQRAAAAATRPATDLIYGGNVNWCVVAAPNPQWATKVFPGEPEEAAMRRLWQAIFAATRVLESDPVEAWRAHVSGLGARRDALNERRFSALHFRGPGTDLTVGLADGHRWLGAEEDTRQGRTYVANIPTEEVFTTPHRLRVNGTAAATKPLLLNGVLVEGLRVRFQDGELVEAHAERGEDVLRATLATDDGARRLGEVALVPHSSPVSQSGLLFLNTLFDENAASHLALGRAYRTAVQGGADMSDEAFARTGGNDSLVHVDWMIGSAGVDVDGLHENGEREPVMRGGEWTLP